MRRYTKVFSEPKHPAKYNLFTFDLGGLELSEDDIRSVRDAAVQGALRSASDLLKRGGRGSAFDSFGTFSTFSTFSTFGSGAASPVESNAEGLIEQAVRGKK